MAKMRDPLEIFTGKSRTIPQVYNRQEHYSPDHPDAEDKIANDDPYNSQLETPAYIEDTRLEMYKQRAPVLVPEFNELYGSTKNKDGWRYVIDVFSQGKTITTQANTLVTTTIAAQSQTLKLSQWPGAIHAYLVLRKFVIAPSTNASAITTTGCLDVEFQDAIGGFVVPICHIISNQSFTGDFTDIIPIPLTDPTNLTLGQINVTLTGTTPTTASYIAGIAFSYAYLLPCLEGYKVESIHQVLRGTTDAEHARNHH